MRTLSLVREFASRHGPNELARKAGQKGAARRPEAKRRGKAYLSGRHIADLANMLLGVSARYSAIAVSPDTDQRDPGLRLELL